MSPYTDARRRRLLVLASLGSGALAAIGAAIPVLGGVLGPAVAHNKYAWRAVGKESDFEVGKTVLVKFERAGVTGYGGDVERTTAWLTRRQDGYLALQNNCMHLGCPVQYQPGSGLYLCPCHGGVYDQTGQPVAGPPRIPLIHLRVRVVSGEVQVRAAPIPLPGLGGRS